MRRTGGAVIAFAMAIGAALGAVAAYVSVYVTVVRAIERRDEPGRHGARPRRDGAPGQG